VALETRVVLNGTMSTPISAAHATEIVKGLTAKANHLNHLEFYPGGDLTGNRRSFTRVFENFERDRKQLLKIEVSVAARVSPSDPNYAEFVNAVDSFHEYNGDTVLHAE